MPPDVEHPHEHYSKKTERSLTFYSYWNSLRCVSLSCSSTRRPSPLPQSLSLDFVVEKELEWQQVYPSLYVLILENGGV